MMAEDLMVRVPQVWTNIFFHLDGQSLHSCRQVSRGWNDFILSQVWRSEPGRRQMRRNLGLAWQRGPHQRSEKILHSKQTIFQSEIPGGFRSRKIEMKMFRFSLENDTHWSEFDVIEHNGEDNEKCWVSGSGHLVIGHDQEHLVVWEKLTQRILSSKVLSEGYNPNHQSKFDSESCELVRVLRNEWTSTRKLEVEKFKVDDEGNVTKTIHNIRLHGQKIALKDYRSPYLLALDIGKDFISLCVFRLEESDVKDIKIVETSLINRQKGSSYKNKALLNYPYVVVTSTYAKMLQVQLYNIETGQFIKEFRKNCYNFGTIRWLRMMGRKILMSMVDYVMLVKCRSSVYIFDLDNLLSEESVVTRELDFCSWGPWGTNHVFLNKTTTAIGTVRKRKTENEFDFNYLSVWSKNKN